MSVSAIPPIVTREEWERARAELLIREKAHTHEADAIAAIDEDETGDIIGKRALIGADVDAADRCADEYIRAVFSRVAQ